MHDGDRNRDERRRLKLATDSAIASFQSAAAAPCSPPESASHASEPLSLTLSASGAQCTLPTRVASVPVPLSQSSSQSDSEISDESPPATESRRRAFDDFVSDDAPSPRSASGSDLAQGEHELESAAAVADILGTGSATRPLVAPAAAPTASVAADAASDSNLQSPLFTVTAQPVDSKRPQTVPSLPQPTQRIVKFVSSDGHTYFLDHSVARVSSVLAGMLLPGSTIRKFNRTVAGSVFLVAST